MRPRSLPILLATAMTAALALLAPTPSRADFVVAIESVTVAANSTGDSFDVTLTNTGPVAVSVAGFSFEITTTTAGLSFTSATINTTVDPYVFLGHSAFGPTINTTSGATLDAADLYDTPAAGTMIAAGETVGLGHVLFNIGSTAGTVTLTTYPATSLADAANHNLTIATYQAGTISLTSVPEPSSLICLLSAVPALAWRARRARALSRRSTPLAGC